MSANEILAQSSVPAAPVSTGALWAGRITSALVVLFLLFDSSIKVMKTDAAVEGTIELGYPESIIVWIGLTLLLSTILYAVPPTAMLGAILVTGYLGGATATQVRIEDPWFAFPVLLGVLAWAGLFLRDPRLRTLIPLRRGQPAGPPDGAGAIADTRAGSR